MSKARQETKIIVVINQKGGVGKSTVAFHLAHAAATGKKRVLCLDMDSQGNLSQFLTGDLGIVDITEGGVGSLLEGKELSPSKTTHPRIELLHGHSKLERYDTDPEVEERGYAVGMRDYLRGLGYDFIVIDTPPATGFRHLVAMYWADVSVIPMEPVLSSIVGLQNVLKVIANIHVMNPGLRWYAMFNRANMRVRSHREKDEYVRNKYGRQILAPLGTRSAVSDAMEESPAQPVWLRRGVGEVLQNQWLDFCKKVISG